jgi:hypothetical protein
MTKATAIADPAARAASPGSGSAPKDGSAVLVPELRVSIWSEVWLSGASLQDLMSVTTDLPHASPISSAIEFRLCCASGTAAGNQARCKRHSAEGSIFRCALIRLHLYSTR